MEQKKAVISKKFKAFGVACIEIRIIADNIESEKRRAAHDAFLLEGEYARLEKIFSRFESQSELCRLNENLGNKIACSREMLEVVENALKHYQATDGFFDPRIIQFLENSGYSKDFSKIAETTIEKIPTHSLEKNLSDDLLIEGGKVLFKQRMDFSGSVKGYASDAAVAFLKNNGWADFIVDSSGDEYCGGRDEDGKKWLVEIEGIPYQKAMLELSDMAVATSGIGLRKWEKEGKRFHHIVNPKNPHEYSFELKSVTVVSKSVEVAEVIAKTLFLRGKQNGVDYALKNDIPCAIIDYRGSVWLSPSLKKFLYHNKQTV